MLDRHGWLTLMLLKWVRMTLNCSTLLNSMRLAAILVSLVLCATPVVARVDTSIVPTEGRTTWAPGVTTGIPARATICATIQASTYGNGATESSAAHSGGHCRVPHGTNRPALGRAVPRQQPHPHRQGDHATRGWPNADNAPQDQRGGRELVHGGGERAVVVIGPNRYPKLDATSRCNLSADGVKGSISVTVARRDRVRGRASSCSSTKTTTRRRLGMTCRIATGCRHTSKIWASDRIVFAKHNPPDARRRPVSGLADMVQPVRTTAERDQGDRVRHGQHDHVHDALHAAYPISKSAQLTRWIGPARQVRGLEDLTVSGGSDGNVGSRPRRIPG